MKARIWALISVVCFLGAIWFWLKGDRVREERAARAAREQAAAQQTSPVRLLSARAVAPLAPQKARSGKHGKGDAQVQSSAAESRPFGSKHPDPRRPWRLRNTSEPLAALRLKETAILLRNALIDTAIPEPVPIPKELKAEGAPGAFLVQARGPITPAFRKSVESAGGRVVAYIPNNAYLARLSPAQAEALRARPGVRAVLPYEPYYKLSPKLIRTALRPERKPAELQVRVTVYPGAGEAARKALAGLEAKILGEGSTPFGPQFAVATKGEALAAVARLPEVELVEPLPRRALMNDLSRVRLGVSSSPSDTNSYLGLTGSNIWVNVNDTGVDAEHPDLKGRVFGDSPQVLTDPSGHGTHVAGTIAGSGEHSPAGTNAVGSPPDASFRGMAPAAKLFVMGVDLTTGPWISDVYLQETAAATNYLTLERTNAMVSNNSWGYQRLYDYDSAAASYDAAVRDALPGEEGSQPLIYVFAAGNEGAGNDDGLGGAPGTITSPGTAKNVITVAAVESLRFITNEVVSGSGEQSVTNAPFYRQSDSDNEVAWYSGRGNVGIGVEGETGRFKPDLAAPGSFVVSTRASGWEPELDTTNIVRNIIENQLVTPDAWNDYSLFVPPDAKKFTIEITPAPTSPDPFPDLKIYAREGDFPGPEDFQGENRAEIDDPSAGPWFYSVENTTLSNVTFNIETRVEIVRNDADSLELLHDLNDPLAPDYRFDSGTSAAAANISGLLALIQEFFETRLEKPYSPALLKALLINRAHSLNPIYNFQVRNLINYQGWGVPELPQVIPSVMTNSEEMADWPIQWVDQSPTNALTTGQTHQYELSIPEEARGADLRVTLVWTDPPGNPAASYKLVNDLDLIVSNKVTGTFYIGNDIPEDSDYNEPAGTNEVELLFDNVNNVENVFLRGPLDTNYAVYVIGRRINVNAVTAHPDGIAQDYALVASITATNAVELVEQPPEEPAPTPYDVITNGIPMLYQKVGANSPLRNYPTGETNQWHFYVFTNAPMPGVETGLTNGPYVAFITFSPPNLSVPRTDEADVDLYVTRDDPGLLDLDPVSLTNAFKSVERGGTEMVAFTNAAIGEVFYVGVKAEDQMASEYGLIGLSSTEPFGEIDENGNQVLHGLGVPAAIPDGSPTDPGAAMVFAVGIFPGTVGRVTVHNRLFHQQLGDLYGELYHQGQFVGLNNHVSGTIYPDGILDALYDDSQSGETPGTQTTDGPGSLLNFLGTKTTGPWVFTVVDNAIGQTGVVEELTIHVRPNPDLLAGYFGTVLPNQFETFFIEAPPDAVKMTVLLSSLTGPLNVYVRRDLPPTVDTYDKAAFLGPPGGELTLTPQDIPPLTPGPYYISLFNPSAVPVDYYIRVEFERDLARGIKEEATDDQAEPIVDDARIRLTNHVETPLLVSDVRVGLRVDHPRVSDLDFRLINPQGARALLVEARGGTNIAQLGFEEVRTNFHHVAVAYDRASGQAALYLDGTRIAERGVGDLRLDTRGMLCLGRLLHTNLFEGQFYGSLDEAGLYSRALLPSEVLAITKFGNQGRPMDSLVSHWSFEGSGADSQGNNPAFIDGPVFAAGQEGQGLLFQSPGDKVAVTNVSGLDVGAGGGMSWSAWFSPALVDTNHVLAVWCRDTNQFGVEIGIEPNPTNGEPPLVYANLRDVNGAEHLLKGTSPTLTELQMRLTNMVYLTLTDNTNITDVPIKFADLTETNFVGYTNQLIGGFESVAADPIAAFAAGETVDGWLVATGSTLVVSLPGMAHTGTNALALEDGAVRREFPLEPGASYELSLVHKSLPSIPGITAWWPGGMRTADRSGRHPWTKQGVVFTVPGEVGEAFYFAGGLGYLEVPDAPELRLPDALTLEMWLRIDPGSPDGGLIAKRETEDPERANFALTFSGGDLLWWFNDPDTEAPETDAPGTGVEALRVPAPSRGVFHHFAGTIRQAASNVVEMVVYLDGQLAGSKLLTADLANAVTDAPIRIGTDDPDAAGGFSGALDEVTLYNRALTQAEAAQIYNLGPLGKGPIDGRADTVVNVVGHALMQFASDTAWRTNTMTFLAKTNTATVDIYAADPGAILDSIELRRTPSVYYLPEEPLKPFIGQRGKGDWVLEVTDRRVGATNLLSPEVISWKLDLSFAPPLIPAVRLTNGVPYTNVIAQGEARYFYVDVPRSATRATNTLTADQGLDLWYNEAGAPQFAATNGDYQLLTNAAFGRVVIATNATWGVDTNETVLWQQPAPQLRPGQRYYLALTNANPDAQFVLQVDFDALDTNVWGVTDLPFGATIVTNIAPTNVMQYFRYSVSPNAAAASFEVYPTNGNVNLYVRRAEPVPDPLPRPDVYDYASENPGVEPEIILVTTNSVVPLTPGDWYLGVLNVDTNAVDYAVRVVETLAPQETVVDLLPDVSLDESAPPDQPVRKFFRFTVTTNVGAVELDLTNPDGPVDIFARLDDRPDSFTFDRMDRAAPGLPARLIIRTNALAPSLTGDWYFAVVPRTNAVVNFTITARFPGQPQPWDLTPETPLRGVLAADTFGAPVGWDYYRVAIPPEAVRAVFTVTPLNGDVNLALKKGLPLPNETNWTYQAVTPGPVAETLVVDTNSWPAPISAGDWYLGVRNMSSFSTTYDVTVQIETGGVPPPIAIDREVQISGGAVTISWSAPPGLRFRVEYATEIPADGPIQWIPIPGEITSPDGGYTFTDDGSLTGGVSSAKFYRIVLLP